MKLAGFTYIEVILTVALMIFVGAMASPFYGNFFFGQESAFAAEELKASLYKARFYSMMGKGGSAWGVALDGNRIVLFQGDDYGTRNLDFNESYTLHELVTVSGLSEVVFERRTGIPNGQPTITVTVYSNVDNSQTHIHTLKINAAGVVEDGF